MRAPGGHPLGPLPLGGTESPEVHGAPCSLGSRMGRRVDNARNHGVSGAEPATGPELPERVELIPCRVV